MKRILYIAENPSSAERLIDSGILTEDDLIILAPSISSYSFDYENIEEKNFPYSKEKPRYKENKNNLIFTSLTWSNSSKNEKNLLLDFYSKNNREDNKYLILDFINKFDEIINACDCDHTGVRAFDFKFEKYFNLGSNWMLDLNAMGIKITKMDYISLSSEELKWSFEKRKDIFESDMHNSLKDLYLKKDFIEYNYNANSKILFSKALDIDEILTKNTIILFNIILKKDMKNVIYYKSKMDNLEIGSCVSRTEIINNLLKLKIIEENKEKKIKVTEKGFLLEKLIINKTKELDSSLNKEIMFDIYETYSPSRSKECEGRFFEKYSKYLKDIFIK